MDRGLVKSLALCVVAVVAFLAPPALSAEFRVATVDVHQVLNQSDMAQAKRKELDKLSRKAKDQVAAKKDELQRLEAKLKTQKLDSKSPEVEKFLDQKKELVRFVEDTEDDLKRQFLESNRELTKQVMEQIREYAKQNQIDLVLDRSERNGSAVLFGAESTDITDNVIASLDE